MEIPIGLTSLAISEYHREVNGVRICGVVTASDAAGPISGSPLDDAEVEFRLRSRDRVLTTVTVGGGKFCKWLSGDAQPQVTEIVVSWQGTDPVAPPLYAVVSDPATSPRRNMEIKLFPRDSHRAP